MILLDVHAHLDFDEFQDDFETRIQKMKELGVKIVVVNGVHPESNRKVQALAEKYDIIKPAYGYYPVHVAENGLEAFYKELAWIKEHKPFALGEVGLDYKFGDDNPHGDLHKDVQIEAFKAFVDLSKELDVPLIIHSRKAESDVINILEEKKAPKVIMHCFMGKKKLVERARDLGFSFSVPVVVTKLQQTQWLVENVPLKQLLTETDAPYLGPIPGKPNTPENVLYSVKKIAQIKGMDEVEVANHLFMNYQKLFL